MFIWEFSIWEFSSLPQKNPLFHPFVLFQAMRSGSGLLGLNAVIILPFNCNAIIVWSLEMFVVRQAFTSMLAKRGTVLCVDVLDTTLMVC